ncbi:unnamed protein product [Rotaria sordida]|uniref:RRM domain-containing protein n=1 Tax=Rotaria sordida TaxID=392033 RepID=A0A819KUZ7_9BILA|nr:unnamed protein product [Rotaria sordida]CAF3952559.1 unnamed protein product [Rotaria sordida]
MKDICTLHVRPIPSGLSFEKPLEDYFKYYGKVNRVARHGTFALITFEDYDSVDKALLDIPHRIGEHTLSVQKYSATTSDPVLVEPRSVSEGHLLASHHTEVLEEHLRGVEAEPF